MSAIAGMSASRTLPPTRQVLQEFWELLPTICVAVVLIAAPFAGTLSLYRTAMFLLVIHAAADWACGLRPAVGRAMQATLALGIFFTAWSLLSAAFGIDPGYSFKRWQSEHLYGFLFFSAVVLDGRKLRMSPILWAGTISTLAIALGVWVDPLSGDAAVAQPEYAKLWKVAYLKGFSSDITWLTSHLLLVSWLGMSALLLPKAGSCLKAAGMAATLAAIWVTAMTYQVMVFFVMALMVATFAAIWTLKITGRRGAWLLVVIAACLAGAIVYRDMVLHPEKKTFSGAIELLTTGRTDNAHIQSRINGASWALHKIGERPFFGWGPGREILRQVEPETFDITEEKLGSNVAAHPPIGHLHNQFADLLVRVGIPGALSYSLFLAVILIAGFRSAPWRVDWTRIPGATLRLAAIVAVCCFLIRLLTETYPASSVSAQYWLLLALACVPPNRWADRIDPKQGAG